MRWSSQLLVVHQADDDYDYDDFERDDDDCDDNQDVVTLDHVPHIGVVNFLLLFAKNYDDH